ncbi:MAG TPA: RagB/SusD family nutrient uptake outer membrane protein, partial [Cyclobacteriaceae bacterium]
IIVTPSLQNNNVFPYMKKLADPSRASQNDPSTRPVVIARFSDVYLIAAEAAFKLGQIQNAADMLNVVRKRAAYRTGTPYAPGGAFGTTTPATMAGDPYPAGITLGDAQAALTITAAQVTLDFILDERTREFYGESMRWLDLVRTQSLLTRVAAWNPVEAGTNIKPTHVLRPIPLDQINLVTVGEKYPQNKGY